MENNSYCLILSSAKTRKEDMITAREKMASLFELKKNQLDKLFTGKPLRFMKNIDYEAAKNYCDAIIKTGISCKIEDYSAKQKTSPKTEKSPESKLTFQKETKKKADKNYFCPACQTQQINSDVCEFCKYDLNTYRKNMAEKHYVEIDNAGYILDRRIQHRRDTHRVRREMIRMEKFSDRRVTDERRKAAGIWQGVY